MESNQKFVKVYVVDKPSEFKNEQQASNSEKSQISIISSTVLSEDEDDAEEEEGLRQISLEVEYQ